jgi:hypothetical protein
MSGGRLGFLAMALLLVYGLFARAEEAETKKPETIDPTGSYEWEYSFNDNPAVFSLDLNWDGKELTGKYTAFNNTTDIAEAKFTPENEISFIANREFNGNKFTVHFEGEAKPAEIVGTVAVDFGQGPQEFDWTAKRVVDVDAVLGVWKLKVETERGTMEPELTITKDGDKLAGHYESRFGDREAKDLAFKDGELTWRIESKEDEDFDFEIKYSGKPSGDKIAGTAEFDFGGNTGTMEFSGERTPPEKAAAAQPAANTQPAAESQPAATAEASAEAAPAAAAETE